MKKILIAITMLGVAAGCHREQATEQVDTQQVDELYAELLGTYKTYTDSLNGVAPTDTSHRAERLLNRFEQHLWRIYKSHPADLDFHLTQSQNDTLWLYAQKFIQARQRHKANLPQDTVPQSPLQPDSLPPQDTIR